MQQQGEKIRIKQKGKRKTQQKPKALVPVVSIAIVTAVVPVVPIATVIATVKASKAKQEKTWNIREGMYTE